MKTKIIISKLINCPFFDIFRFEYNAIMHSYFIPFPLLLNILNFCPTKHSAMSNLNFKMRFDVRFHTKFREDVNARAKDCKIYERFHEQSLPQPRTFFRHRFDVNLKKSEIRYSFYFPPFYVPPSLPSLWKFLDVGRERRQEDKNKERGSSKRKWRSFRWIFYTFRLDSHVTHMRSTCIMENVIKNVKKVQIFRVLIII